MFGICTLINPRFGPYRRRWNKKERVKFWIKSALHGSEKKKGSINNSKSKTLGIVLYIGWNVLVNKTWLKDPDFFYGVHTNGICISVF
jgi:hypothetical protein